MPKKLTLHLILFLALLFSSCTKKEDLQQYPVLGVDSMTDIALLEEPGEALALWAEKEIADAIFVHAGPRDAMAAVKPENIQTLRQLIKEKSWKAIRESYEELYDNSNYMNAAVQLKLVKKIYWIIPYRFFEDIPLADEKITGFLKTSGAGFNEDEINNMKMDTGCLKGKLSGADIHICSLFTLPKITEPVLVNIDVSFFPAYAREYEISKLRALKWFLDQLTPRKMRGIYVTISYSIESGLTEPVHRYIGDELLEGLRNPQVLEAQTPPELWQFRDMAENMLSGGEDQRVVEYLEEPLKKYPDDMPLRLMNASAKVLLKRFDEAFRDADEICRMDKHYCHGFAYLGSLIAQDNKNEWREKFFKEALKVLPESNYVRKSIPKDLAVN